MLCSDWLRSAGYPLLTDIQIRNHFEPAILVGELMFVSSATPLKEDGTEIIGRVGETVELGVAQSAACFAVAHSLSLLQMTIGRPLLASTFRVVDLTFFINSAQSFADHSAVADPASRLLIGLLGDLGKHSRSAIGVTSLVRGVSVVVKGVYQRVE